MHALIDQTRRFAAGEKKNLEPLTSPVTEEVALLSQSFAEMARADVLAPAAGTGEIAPLVEKLRARYREQGLAVPLAGELTAPAKLPGEILETVLTNLFDNSRQNGASSVAISAVVADGNLSLTIADNGAGISPANREKIFTPFFTTRRDEGGTGLGLGIVRALLKAYGGDIELITADKGAVFRVTLPVGR